MKKFLSVLLVATAFCQHTLAEKIAVVDLEKLVNLHPNTAADKKLYKQTFDDFSAEKETLEASARTARKDFEAAVREAQNPALSESAKKAAEEKAMAKRNAAIEAERDAIAQIRKLQSQLDSQERRMLKRTISEIEVAIRRFAEIKEIDLVLQLPASKLGGGGTLYAKPEMDITRDIMKLIGIEEPAELEAETEDGADAKPSENTANEAAK